MLKILQGFIIFPFVEEEGSFLLDAKRARVAENWSSRKGESLWRIEEIPFAALKPKSQRKSSLELGWYRAPRPYMGFGVFLF
ncbi:MAG: hypothetical protein MR990_05285 [Mollicutes bacterium]|nr:hypothetical protein [Mollicutes bacterium]